MRGLIGAAVVIVAALSGFTLQGDDFFYRLNKGIDVYGRVYREVSTNYVDEIDPLELMEAGIDGMLGSLDPYTNFINDEEGDEVELITSGRYGGIGVTVGTRDGHITIMSVMDGYSAQKQGLLPGDRLLRIDSRAIADLKPSEVRVLTRGTPGTEVKLVVERDGEAAPLEFILVREEIRLRNVSYAGILGDGVGYIRLERFSRDAGDEIALALKDFRLRGTLRGVVLDLRNNPGGLLDAAVDVVGKFLPRGSLIVSTRGRKPESERKYFSTADPLVPDLPLVVLINNNSASASEIVAAAVQDLDRGVILGTRSFGKGLVQTVTPLVYNTQLKITTAKYYTPSGRCLQEIDYAKGGARDTAAAKALFRTSKGRSEYANGGVAPDTVVEESGRSPVHAALMRRSMFFRFAANYRRGHDGPAEGADTLLAKFTRFLEEQKFAYEDDAVQQLDETVRLVRKSGGDTAVVADIEALKKRLAERAGRSIGDHRDEIVSAIDMELGGLAGGEAARIAAGLNRDNQVASAVGIIADRREYDRRLTLGMKDDD
ncbi:MAG TPA: S41 family peptidase [Bacteroidota bacterium]|nr:S41 family peptidase [Bacteroidota bacterium]